MLALHVHLFPSNSMCQHSKLCTKESQEIENQLTHAHHHFAQTNFKRSRTKRTLQKSQNYSSLLSKTFMLLAIAENGVQKVAIFENPLLKKQLSYLQFFFILFKHHFVKLALSFVWAKFVSLHSSCSALLYSFPDILSTAIVSPPR